MRIFQGFLDAVYACIGLSDPELGEHELTHQPALAHQPALVHEPVLTREPVLAHEPELADASLASAEKMEVSTLTGLHAFFDQELGFPAAAPGRVYLRKDESKST